MQNNKDNWDLNLAISESDQADVQKISLATKNKRNIRRLLCRLGIHKYSCYQGITRMAFQAINEGTGESVMHDFELGMRCCFKCGRPGVRLRRI